MFNVFRRAPVALPEEPAGVLPSNPLCPMCVPSRQAWRDADGLGKEAAQLRGTLEDTSAVAVHQQDALKQLTGGCTTSFRRSPSFAISPLKACNRWLARATPVAHVGQEVSGVVATLQGSSWCSDRHHPNCPADPVGCVQRLGGGQSAGVAGAGFLW